MTTGSTVSYAGIIGPGQTLPVAIVGSFFYFSVLTAPVFARPTGGTFCQYVNGTGLENISPSFSKVEIQNPNSTAVTFQIVCGSDGFIDKRLIQNQDIKNVTIAYVALTPPWVKDADSAWQLLLTDLSGTTFSDVLGNKWIAISRVLFSAQTSPLSGSDMIVHTGTTLANGIPLATAAAADNTPLVFESSGDFLIYIDGGLLGANVYEIYQAVAPGFSGAPPN